MSSRARRVVIKSRVVQLRQAGREAVVAHLRYIERDGTTRDGTAGRAYGPDADVADVAAFEARGKDDRHQFRMIVSVEDAESLESLPDYTRELMRQMSVDLETPLDWVAVDHWDTDNAHTHVVLRGRTSSGQDLVIAPNYMSHGMRQRAMAVATEWLGPRTELEVTQSLQREVTQERFTSLDQALARAASPDGVLNLMRAGGHPRWQGLLQARLQHLETMALASPVGPAQWRIDADLRPTLSTLGERGDILRAMHRAMRGRSDGHAECVLPDAEGAQGFVGRIAAKGLADELTDRGYVVVDGTDGRMHYAAVSPGSSSSDLPVGGIVEVSRRTGTRTSDRAIVEVAREGVYRTAEHRALLERDTARQQGSDGMVEACTRRLEALRRAGTVERVGEGIWKVPSDLPERGQRHDIRHSGNTILRLCSHLTIEQQIHSAGATWLDRHLSAQDNVFAKRGFGAEVRAALEQRKAHLIEQGLVRRSGSEVRGPSDLLTVLQRRDLKLAASEIEAQTGLRHRPIEETGRFRGIYRRSVLLASGRFALLDSGTEFSLVPWRAVIEPRVGQWITAMTRGATVSWEFGNDRRMGR